MHKFLLDHNGHRIIVMAEQESDLRYSFAIDCLECDSKGYFPYVGKIDD